jgi:hypothetical protein
MKSATKRAKAPSLRVASEAHEQRTLIEWARLASVMEPRLRLLMAIPNQAVRASNVRHLVAEGVRAGVPDLFLPTSSGGFHGLFIELKRRSGGRLSPEQREWIAKLRGQGYRAEVCAGWEAAKDIILEYLHCGTWLEVLTHRAPSQEPDGIQG